MDHPTEAPTMTVVKVLAAWLLIGAVVAPVVGWWIKRCRIADVTEDVFFHLHYWQGTWQSAHDIACELDLAHGDVVVALTTDLAGCVEVKHRQRPGDRPNVVVYRLLQPAPKAKAEV